MSLGFLTMAEFDLLPAGGSRKEVMTVWFHGHFEAPYTAVPTTPRNVDISSFMAVHMKRPKNCRVNSAYRPGRSD